MKDINGDEFIIPQSNTSRIYYEPFTLWENLLWYGMVGFMLCLACIVPFAIRQQNQFNHACILRGGFPYHAFRANPVCISRAVIIQVQP